MNGTLTLGTGGPWGRLRSYVMRFLVAVLLVAMGYEVCRVVCGARLTSRIRANQALVPTSTRTPVSSVLNPALARVLMKATPCSLQIPRIAASVFVPVHRDEGPYLLLVKWIEETPSVTAVRIRNLDTQEELELSIAHGWLTKNKDDAKRKMSLIFYSDWCWERPGVPKVLAGKCKLGLIVGCKAVGEETTIVRIPAAGPEWRFLDDLKGGNQ